MGYNTKGQSWPLNVVFVVTLVGGVAGIIGLPVGHLSDTGIIVTLMILAMVTCILLYVPRIYLMTQFPKLEALNTRIDNMCRAVLGAQENQDQIAAISTALTEVRTAVTNLSTQVTSLNSRFDTKGDLRTQLDSANTKLDAIKTKTNA